MVRRGVLQFFRGVSLFLALALVAAEAQASSNAGITYSGRLVRPDGSPVDGTNVQFRLQIRTPGAEDCLMYEEQQAADLSNSGGRFSLGLNSGAGLRQDSSGYTIDQIFANRGTFAFNSVNCSATNTFTPSSASGRKLRVFFNDGTFAGWEPLPAMDVNYVPFAVEASQVAGFKPSSFVRVVDGAGVPQPAPALTAAQADELGDLLDGTSPLYTRANQLGGQNLPALGAGQVLGWNGTAWTAATPLVSETDPSVSAFAKAALPTCGVGQVLKSDGTSFSCVADSTGGVPGDATTAAKGLVQIDAAGGLSVTAGVLSLPNSGVSAGTHTKVTVDAKGRVTAGANLAEGDIPTLSTAGKVSGSAINTGTIGGNAAINTTGNVTATNLSANNTALKTLEIFKTDNSAKITVQAPAALGANYSLTLPLDDGTPNQVLTTDGAGALSWTTPAAVGESNTVSNIGVAGIGLFKQKTGVNFEFKKINAASNKISVSDDAANNELDLDVNEANLSLGNIGGTLPLNKGGTNASLTAANGGVAYSTATALALTAPGSAGQILRSNGAAAPTWSTATYPATTTANQLLYSSGANTVAGLTSANSSVLLTDGSGVPAWSAISNDSFTQYALLAGRATGQTLRGGLAASEDLVLDSTAHATKGDIVLGPSGGRVGLGTASPIDPLHIVSGTNSDIFLGTGTSNAGEHQIGFGFHTGNSWAASIAGIATGSNGRGNLEFRVAPGTDLTSATAANTVLRLTASSAQFLQPTSVNAVTIDGSSASNKRIQVLTDLPSPADSSLLIKAGDATYLNRGGGNLVLSSGGNAGSGTGVDGYVSIRTSLSSAASSTTNATAEVARFLGTGQVGIGTSTPAATSLLDLTSTTRGFLAPRMTTAQRDAIASPAAGLQVYNTNTNQLNVYNGSVWQAMGVVGGGIDSLNGLATATQTFATPGTTGTAPTWSSAGSAHTLNIPMAATAGVTAGLISKAQYDAFNAKLGAVSATAALTNGRVWIGSAGNIATEQQVSGDLSLTNAGVATVANLAISTGKIADLAVTNAKLADASITTAKIFANPGVNRLVGTDGTTGANLGAVVCGTANHVLKWTVATGWQCDTVVGLIGTGAITSTHLADGTVTSTDIADATITSTDLASSLTNGLWSGDGTDVYRTSGDVGINTSNPGTATKLDVRLGGSGVGTAIAISENATDGFVLGGNLAGNGGANRFFIGRSDYNIGDGATYAAPKELLSIRGDGLVGIGTDNPLTKLHLDGGTAGAGLTISSDTTGNSAFFNLRDTAANNMWHFVMRGADHATEPNQMLFTYSPNAGTNFHRYMTFMPNEALDNTAGNVAFHGGVGIGTTTPGTDLHIVGTGTNGAWGTFSATGAGSYIRVGEANNSINLAIDGNSIVTDQGLHIANTNTDPIILGTNNAESMRIINGGNVGIGTTTPVTKLHVSSATANDGVLITGASSERVLMAMNTNTGSWNPITLAGDKALIYGGSAVNAAGGFVIAPWRSTGGLATGIRMDQDGNVGLGTTAPVASLHVRSSGASGKTFANNTGLVIENSGNQNGFFALQVSTAGANDAFAVTNAGNVGIGTSSPGHLLNLQRTSTAVYASSGSGASGTMPWTAAAGTDPVLMIRNSYVASGSASYIGFSATEAGARNNMAYIGSVSTAGGYAPSVVFGVRNTDTTYAERMRIDAAGRLGLGTDAPAEALHIVRNAPKILINTLDNTAPSLVLQARETSGSAARPDLFFRNEAGVDRGGLSYNMTTDVMVFKSGNNDRMYLTSSGQLGIGESNPAQKLHVAGNVRVDGGSTSCTLGNGAGATNCSSDVRLKTNITPIPDALAKILQLRGVEFDWNENARAPGTHAIGVIAQDVEKQFPTTVIEDEDGIKMVDYAALVAPLIEAVRELNRKIASVGESEQRENQALAAENAALRAELETLRKEHERTRSDLELIKKKLGF